MSEGFDKVFSALRCRLGVLEKVNGDSDVFLSRILQGNFGCQASVLLNFSPNTQFIINF